MAGNKVNTKTKGKEEKGKVNKGVTQINEDGEDIDFAVLRKPIPTSITGFAQARKIFDLATEELKDLLSNECDLLYECKVCRNIFRSLGNFISHKRVYCKEKFSTSLHGHFINNSSTLNEYLDIKHTEEGYQKSLKEKNETDSNEKDDYEDRIPLTKDLTAVYEKIIKTKGIPGGLEQPQVVLKKIPSTSIAMFQNIRIEDKKSDHMRAQVKELDRILSRDEAVLQSDGKFTIQSSKESEMPADSDSVIQISDDDENDDSLDLKCKICELQFSTQKTLKFHMKYKHLESRLVFPCPDCLEIFSTSWSVYRHLFKVHRKTAAQIRRLRESIQSKAFRMNNPPAFYEKRKNNLKVASVHKITEEERLDQENQAWMDNMEGDGEVPRCGGCGRTFERRAALAAHTHTCQPRSRALARRPESKKIEIQIRKDYNKGPVTGITILKATDSNDTKASSEETQVATKPQENEKVSEVDDKDDNETRMDVEEDDQKSNGSAESPEKINEVQPLDDVKPVIRLPFALQAEKSNLAAFKQRIFSEIDFLRLLCKKCDTKHNSAIELYAHMAEHVKWMRYSCKLCNFKHYSFEKLPEHVKVVHKLKGDSDFYFSTVKAIDGTEAMIISRCLAESESTDETNDTNETSPESRRPSRCSSDSSRLSDDSSSSSTLKETGTRKRKMYQNKSIAKKKKQAVTNDDGEDLKDGDTPVDKVMKVILSDSNNSSNVKTFEENSSDLEDIEDKLARRQNTEGNTSVASRRPVRKRTKPKNEDFEYDLSNLLKMEAQGYRDSQSVTTSKTYQTKKKVQPETPTTYDKYDTINKDCCGALVTLSKKAIETASAHMKTSSFPIYSIRDNRPTTFVRPMLPRAFSRSDKGSPKKDIEESKDVSSQNKASKTVEQQNSNDNELSTNDDKNNSKAKEENTTVAKKICKLLNTTVSSLVEYDTKLMDVVKANTELVEPTKITSDSSLFLERNGVDGVSKEKVKSNVTIPAVVPIKFRRQSLEVIKNPLINKNITDFSKAGMKTKILVIKPINRNNDGTRPVNTPLKFQTIKLKDPSKSSNSSEDKQSDQVMVVKVPKVSRATVSEIQTPHTSTVVNISSQINIDKKCEENTTTETIPVNTTQTEAKCDSDKQSKENETSSDTIVQESVTEIDKPKVIEASS